VIQKFTTVVASDLGLTVKEAHSKLWRKGSVGVSRDCFCSDGHCECMGQIWSP